MFTFLRRSALHATRNNAITALSSSSLSLTPTTCSGGGGNHQRRHIFYIKPESRPQRGGQRGRGGGGGGHGRGGGGHHSHGEGGGPPAEATGGMTAADGSELSMAMMGGDNFREIDSKEAAKLKHIFYDRDQKKCTLCNETITHWNAHMNHIPHQARLGIVERLLSGKAGPPDLVAKKWWRYLNTDENSFERIMELSSPKSEDRRRRLVYLLNFLQEKGILREAFGVTRGKSLHRSWEFERFEMIGDNVVKYCFYDRMLVLFPLHEGGINGKLGFIQQLIDSNEGLLRCYDYLQVDKIIGQRLAASKFKADVVEALFGELQVYLWATEAEWGDVEYDYPFQPEVQYARGLVNHALNELIHVLLMFAIEGTLQQAGSVIKEMYRTDAFMVRSGGGASGSALGSGRMKYWIKPYLDEKKTTRGEMVEKLAAAATVGKTNNGSTTSFFNSTSTGNAISPPPEADVTAQKPAATTTRAGRDDHLTLPASYFRSSIRRLRAGRFDTIPRRVPKLQYLQHRPYDAMHRKKVLAGGVVAARVKEDEKTVEELLVALTYTPSSGRSDEGRSTSFSDFSAVPSSSSTTTPTIGSVASVDLPEDLQLHQQPSEGSGSSAAFAH